MLQKKIQSFPLQEPSVTNSQGGHLYLLATKLIFCPVMSLLPLFIQNVKHYFQQVNKEIKKRIRSAGYRIGSLVTCARTHAAQCKNVYHWTLTLICVNSKEAICLLTKVECKGRKTYKIITLDSGNDRKIKNYCWLDTSLLISQKSIAEVYAAETTKWL